MIVISLIKLDFFKRQGMTMTKVTKFHLKFYLLLLMLLAIFFEKWKKKTHRDRSRKLL